MLSTPPDNVVVRTFAWIVILGRQGILNKALSALGLTDAPIDLLFTEPGVIVVLAQVQMPLMVLPLLTTLQRIDPNLAAASAARVRASRTGAASAPAAVRRAGGAPRSKWTAAERCPSFVSRWTTA